MTPTLSSTLPVAGRPARHASGSSSRHDRARRKRKRAARQQGRVIARYLDQYRSNREVVACHGLAGSVLVVDRDAATHGDRRLVAHLSADEPAENAALVCAEYLRESPGDRCRCRRITAEDSRVLPFAEDPPESPQGELAREQLEPVDRHGSRYRLERLWGSMSIPELRWCRYSPSLGRREPLSMREVVASLESYEPVRALTLQALAAHCNDASVSTAVLRMELKRVLESPIVLNRRLREVVLATAERQELSLSEIASRCGRVKRDCKGNESGETSWLARRLGLLPEAGRGGPTPWIHSDVLALIARRGLGIGPREVELT